MARSLSIIVQEVLEMQIRSLGRRRSPLIYYGMFALLAIILFVLGTRLGAILFEKVRQPLPAENRAAAAPGGAAKVEPPVLVQDFTLTSQTGQPLSLSELRGQPVLLFFGYTHCPEECPLTLAEFTQVKSQLGDLGDRVHFLFISVDGERDTPSVMADFLQRFDDSFVGMTGDPDSLRQLGTQFGLMFEAVVPGNDGSPRPATDQDENYFVSHISPSFLIDQGGYLSRVFFYGTKPNVIASNLRQLLNVG
ncbi:MAG: SCO family protein [Anaerolineae bacterium]|nr:SCO family protein [Anaerolineae bacterium]